MELKVSASIYVVAPLNIEFEIVKKGSSRRDIEEQGPLCGIEHQDFNSLSVISDFIS
jgi:hypothetical protein